MRQWRVGSLSMGLMLIVLGAIMIVGRTNGWSAIENIIKWWPVILILLGIEVLVTAIFQRSEQTKVRMDGLSIFIIILIMIICAGAFGVDRLSKNKSFFNINIDGIHHGIHIGSKYETQVEKNFTVDANGKDKVVVDNEYGRVKVSKGTGNKIEVNAQITIYNDDEEYAKSMAGSLIKIDEKSTVSISSNSGDYDHDKIKSFDVSYDIKVPEGLALDVKDSFGSVEVDGITKSVNIKNNNGSVSANSIGGDLLVDNSFASVNVKKIGGKAEIHGQNGSINVDDVGGTLNITNKFASVNVKNIKGDTSIENGNGSVDADKIGGKLTVDNKFGRITANDVSGSIDLKGGNGKITASSVGGDASIENEFGSIELNGANKYIKLITKNGGINVSADKPVEKGMDITNQFGSIEVKVPNSQQGKFYAETSFGSISSDINLTLEKNTNEQKLNGTIGDGSAAFNIQNKNGSIRIKTH